MSNNNTEDSPFQGLDNLNLGPAWARSQNNAPKDKYKKYETSEEPRKGKKGHQRSNHSGHSGDRDFKRGKNSGDRRQGGQGAGKFNKGRSNSNRRPTPAAAPTWVNAAVMPVEASLDSLANEIKGAARSYLVFDLSRTTLKERSRFRINFQSTDESKKLYRVRKDNSLWISREEAFSHILKNETLLDTYYKKFTKEVDAPTGSYTSVAKCGFSGEILGPPNFHEYQKRVAKIHREKFSNLSLEAYKNRIKIDQTEEAVAEWLEQAKILNYYIPTSELPAEAITPEAVESTESTPEAPIPTTTDENADAVSNAEVTETSETAENSEESTPKTELVTTQALERHFLENHYSQAIEESSKSWVLGDIEGKKLSPPLLTLLKDVVSEERRYPGKLSAILCRQMSGRHIAVYKWDGKLRAGPARPKALPSDISLSEKIETLSTWIDKNSGSDIKKMWSTLLSEDISEEDKHLWYADLHWLINQGYVIFTSDGHIHIAKKGQVSPQNTKKVTTEAPSEKKTETPATETTQVEKPAEAPKNLENNAPTEVISDQKTEDSEKNSKEVEESA